MWPVQKVLINLFCVLSLVLIYLSNLVLVRMNYTVIFSTLPSIQSQHFTFVFVWHGLALLFLQVVKRGHGRLPPLRPGIDPRTGSKGPQWPSG